MAASPGCRDVPVTIRIEKDGAITVSPDPFFVSKGKNQEVAWICSDRKAYFTVDFDKNGSPFYEQQFSSSQPCSGLVRRAVLPDPHKTYSYTVRVRGKTLDPDGGILP
jgi:hypothetical protein